MSPVMRRVSVESRRKRIMWDNDNARVDGRTSIRVLLEWLTTLANYDRWCESKTRGGGETREQLCTEIREEMEEEGLFHRKNANIRTQINELERSYASAVAWLGANGFDVRDSRVDIASVERHVLKICPYFRDLHHVMNGRRALLGPGRAVSPTRAARGQAEAERMSEASHEDPRQQPRASDLERESAETRPMPLGRTRQEYSPERRSVYAVSNGSRSWQGSQRYSGGSYLLDGREGSLSVPWRVELPPQSPSRGDAQSSDEDESRDRKRLRMEKARHRLEYKKLQYEVETKRLRLETERLLSRRKLAAAGVSAEEIEGVLSDRNGEAGAEASE